MMHRDIVSSQKALEIADRFGPFQPWFFFDVAAVEIVMMTTFGFAVTKASFLLRFSKMLLYHLFGKSVFFFHRKEIENHSWLLISTVFIIMMPALARGIQNGYGHVY